ncbi:YitT family protein [Eupransor demetentiae]|uniref:Contains DUF161 and DUF2179 domains (YitT) n=1 Tax=Eupransor demetentiae TaxID=3109584 RepID=A0ABP0EN69_9LACO|nr:Uncharacterized membrane-anchored protein YitT [Lactobacillaceae bacterium LMG 33000]
MGKKSSLRKIGLTVLFFFVSVTLQVVGLNFFLIPNDIFSVGINGVAQLLSIFGVRFLHTSIDTGVFILVLNIPIGIIGWRLIGGKFTLLSFLNSVAVSVALIVVPVGPFTTQPLLASLFGSVLVGTSVGLALRYGFSTGGLDIIAMVVQKRTGKSIGVFMNAVNFVIVLIAGSFIGWQNALYTLIGIYANGRVVDTIYTGYQKVTALIVTTKGQEVVDALHRDFIRGITILPSQGAYTKRDSQTLMMVISRYELFEMQETVRHIDPKAFINFVSTVSVAGEFLDADRQLQMRKSMSPKPATIDAQVEAEKQLEDQLQQIQEQQDNQSNQ